MIPAPSGSRAECPGCNTDFIKFVTSDLCSKWGFGDGDMLDDWKYEREQENPLVEQVHDHELLVRVVLMEVVPLIKNELELFCVHTIHNPIRARRVDGVEVDTFADNEFVIDPPFVMVDEEKLAENLAWLMHAREAT